MLQKTSTINAQWVIVESNDKRYSRIKVLRSIVEAIEKGLKKNNIILINFLIRLF
ncbi:hypothetical protein [Methanosarcina barkeri]|uniref:hypothetical protein n=1 Tax=Methanosarcina barkeri TaxID=2208 RepID=UPI0024364CDD|nr:hypothetical protein [Methanosarcina barkeri]